MFQQPSLVLKEMRGLAPKARVYFLLQLYVLGLTLTLFAHLLASIVILLLSLNIDWAWEGALVAGGILGGPILGFFLGQLLRVGAPSSASGSKDYFQTPGHVPLHSSGTPVALFDSDEYEALLVGCVGGISATLLGGWVGILLFNLPLYIAFVGSMGAAFVAQINSIRRDGPTAGILFGALSVFLLWLSTTILVNRTVAVEVAIIGLVTFFLFYFRPIYLPTYLFKYVLAKFQPNKSMAIFQSSSVFRDECVAFPFPLLTKWLIDLAVLDRRATLIEIEHIRNHLPYQKRAATLARFWIAVDDLSNIDSMALLAKAGEAIEDLPVQIPTRGWSADENVHELKRRIMDIAGNAVDYSEAQSLSRKISLLSALKADVRDFDILLSASRYRPRFQQIADSWSKIISDEYDRVRREFETEPIPNPFIIGKPIVSSDELVFVERRDIIGAIEDNIIDPQQQTSLLLYGRRRIGKTSTLKNLSRLLSSQYITVFIDFLNGKWRESEASFGYYLVKEVLAELSRHDLNRAGYTVFQTDFFHLPLSKLNDWLDQIETILDDANKRVLLTFDEYERLAEDGHDNRLAVEILSQLRTIIQHRKNIVVLFSGGHRFQEMPNMNWSDYLINAKTIELSFLSEKEARLLLTAPVPKVKYDGDILDRIIRVTHCQPFLVQCFGFELVNLLNKRGKFVAGVAEYQTVLDNVLIAAQSYFYETWTEGMSDDERSIMLYLATKQSISVRKVSPTDAFLSLIHKEVVEEKAGKYRLAIDCFRLYLIRNFKTSTANSPPPGLITLNESEALERLIS